MFEHVTILLSFVFAIALTHLLASTTELIWAHERVRFSWLQALWMYNALQVLFTNWVGMFYLKERPHWDVPEIAIDFIAALFQYYTCSLIAIRVKDDGPIDMPDFYERKRPFIFAAFLTMTLFNMFQNWWDGELLSSPYELLIVELTLTPLLVFVVLAGWARPRWLQWIGGIGYLLLTSYFLFTFALGDVPT
jgi:hypothetical protein